MASINLDARGVDGLYNLSVDPSGLKLTKYELAAFF